jgi:hypothetical protein
MVMERGDMAQEKAWEKIRQRLRDGLTGDITLHVTQGRITRMKITEEERVGPSVESIDKPDGPTVDLHT